MSLHWTTQATTYHKSCICYPSLTCQHGSMARDCSNVFTATALLFLQMWMLPSPWPEIVPMQHLSHVHCYCFTLLSHVDASSNVLDSCLLYGQRLSQCNIFLMFTATASLFYHMWMLTPIVLFLAFFLLLSALWSSVMTLLPPQESKTWISSSSPVPLWNPPT